MTAYLFVTTIYTSLPQSSLLIFGLTLLPSVWPHTEAVLQQDWYLNVIYAAVSLAVALVTFGVLGDSTATLKEPWGLTAQVGGSAAGFIVFFYMLSSGLQQYEDKLFLLRDVERDELLRQTVDLSVITPTITQTKTIDGGRAEINMPRSAKSFYVDIHGTQGTSWHVVRIEPSECWKSTTAAPITNACSDTFVFFVQGRACLDSIILVLLLTRINLCNRPSTTTALLRLMLFRLRLP